MSGNPYLPRFLVRRDARGDWMVWDRHTNGPAEFDGRAATGLTEENAEDIRSELTKKYISGERIN
jgi:hypothetical protein